MRSLAIALLLLASVAAAQPVSEQSYLASRDAYIAKFAAVAYEGVFGDDVMAALDEALGDLETQLKTIIGPVTLPGFSPDGAIGLETLFDSDIGFGMLDGLVYGADDSDASVLVTTKGLADAWLVGHRDWWDSPTIPDNIRDALKVNAFYTQAISADAAVARFAEIPVTPPAGADFAYAILDMRSQDYAIGVPDEMIVAVVGGGRVFLANAPVTASVHAIPACDTIWQDYSARGEAALQQSDAEDDGQSDDFDQIYTEGEAAFQDCFAEQAKDQDFYPALVAEAQALADKLH